MSIYDRIEAEARARFPEEFERDVEFQRVLREGREFEARQAQSARLDPWLLGGFLAFVVVAVLVAAIRGPDA